MAIITGKEADRRDRDAIRKNGFYSNKLRKFEKITMRVILFSLLAIPIAFLIHLDFFYIAVVAIISILVSWGNISGEIESINQYEIESKIQDKIMNDLLLENKITNEEYKKRRALILASMGLEE
ncbi:hypothetical protein LL037_21500 [Clostridium estertheticum]|uniref:hypothetical protein n=1 Tax=Clostridium estertheticum TaxID=238834 RepID=UPI001C0BB920|nr:hypothetical protein [Clostridium estertheticum]MBU3198319.1 hypothetical protein [Clostridium estertheticum]WAG65006.1 hypothetical protein LL037_21500 [Clostridium estertheticum]